MYVSVRLSSQKSSTLLGTPGQIKSNQRRSFDPHGCPKGPPHTTCTCGESRVRRFAFSRRIYGRMKYRKKKKNRRKTETVAEHAHNTPPLRRVPTGRTTANVTGLRCRELDDREKNALATSHRTRTPNERRETGTRRRSAVVTTAIIVLKIIIIIVL